MTLQDVAREAGVHYSTVSRALDPNKAWRVNLDTRQQVQKVAHRLGYQRDVVASGLKRGRSQTVGIVISDLTNTNAPMVLRGIVNGLEPEGMMPLICETHDDSEQFERILKQLISRRIDALLVVASRLGDAPLLRRLRRQGVPTVLAVQNVPGVRLPACTYDDHLGGRLAAEHLLGLGHRRLAQLRGPEDIYSCAQRAAGFSQAVRKAGATEVVVDETAPFGTADAGRRLMRRLMKHRGKTPTGLFVHHDLMAFGVLAVAAEQGLRCPDDLSVVGYHDLPYVELIQPPLTSIRLPREDLGRAAAEMMLEVMRSENRVPLSRKLQPTLVVRRSTAPPAPLR